MKNSNFDENGYFRDTSFFTKIRDFMHEHRKWMFLLQPLGLLIALSAILICSLVILHVIEGNFFLIFTIIFMYSFSYNFFIIGKGYNNKMDRGTHRINSRYKTDDQSTLPFWLLDED